MNEIKLINRAWEQIFEAIEGLEDNLGIECDTPDYIILNGKKYYYGRDLPVQNIDVDFSKIKQNAGK